MVQLCDMSLHGSIVPQQCTGINTCRCSQSNYKRTECLSCPVFVQLTELATQRPEMKEILFGLCVFDI